MYNIGYIILDIVIVISTLWIVDKFWSSFFERKRGILSAFAWLCLAIWQFLFMWTKGDIHTSATIVNILLFLWIVVSSYKCTGKERYFLLAFFYSVWALSEVLVFYLIRNIPMEQEQINIIGSVVSKIIIIIFVHLFTLMWKEKKYSYIPTKYYFFLLLVPVGSIYIAIVEFYMIGNTFFSLTTVSVLLVFNVVIFEMYAKLNESFISDTKKTVYAQQLEIISKSTEEQMKMMEEFHEEKHNLTNELIALKSGIEMNDRKTALKNINKIIKSSNKQENICSSGNSVVDAIINFKYAVAKDNGIRFLLKIFIPEEMPIDQCDIGVVLGNAIDNAIEATMECNKNEKVIEIILGIKKETLVIIVKNPYEHQLNRDRNGDIISSKKEKKRHGFRLNSINRIAEEYGGAMVLDIGDNRFSIIATLNLG